MASISVTVESIAAGGDGVARAEGFVVFVPRSAPGDVGTVDIAMRGSFARAEFVRLEHPAPSRVEPPCPHYTMDRCGGCQLQHMEYAAQLAAKSGIIRDSITRIGKRSITAPEVLPSAKQWRYRRKLTLAMRRSGARWIAGLHPYDSPHKVFALNDCPITDERVVTIWKEIMSAQSMFPIASALRGAVRIDEAGATFVLEGGDVWPEAPRFFESVSSLNALWWIPEKKRRRLMQQRGDSNALGASFVQVNAPVAAQMHDYVLERVLAHNPAKVIDGYSGAGELALALAATGVRVSAIELDSDASSHATVKLPGGSTSVSAKVEAVLGSLLPADVVVLNPPRTGVDGRVTEQLGQSDPAPRAIVYVSCNPATLARDLTRMPGYRIASLRAYDMFPQTAHVETVCELVPANA
ncbi:MAG: class I SAM-dependent RNA methyltransferase [Gemmatimonadaceae bacterium]|nr:class I SAM-dependent RNA methyltransferase [Gemmatimonadaceae bacterium]